MSQSEYKTTIGLEIHTELKTVTKMFCRSKNDPEETRPNVNICPICLGYPGTLPVINSEAVRHVVKVGLAVGGEIADFTEFDRKNYFYPDIPKGYQISQYKHPLVSNGEFNGIKITRVHLEEDTAKSSHDQGNYSLVDFNRAGVPLMELVTEPVIKSAKEAADFARELQLLLQYLGVAAANMEKGEMRVEANISVSKTVELGTKTEVKNLNSFRSVERAIEFEIERQIEVLESGGRVVQETRGWDERKQITFAQRGKEDSHDYRYFPDPDLPKLKLSEIPGFINDIRKEIPELPAQRRERLSQKFGLKEEDVETYVRNLGAGAFFEAVTSEFALDHKLCQLASNYITSDILGLMAQEPELEITDSGVGKLVPTNFAVVIKMIAGGELSSRGAKDLIKHLITAGGEVEAMADSLNLIQQNDDKSLQKTVATIIAENESVVADYKNGKESALQFLLGQAMKATKGSANPQKLKEIFVESLK